MSKLAKKSSIVAALFSRIFLIITYLICLVTFILGAIILLLPNYVQTVTDLTVNSMTEHGLKTVELAKGVAFGYWQFVDNEAITSKPTSLSAAGIAVVVLWAFSVVMSLILSISISKAKYTIGKKNKVIRAFIPIHLAIIFVVVVGLLAQPNYLTMEYKDNGAVQHSFSLVSKKMNILLANGADKNAEQVKSTILNTNTLEANFKNYTTAGYVFFGVVISIGLGIVIDMFMFLLRVLFNRTRDKEPVNA
ncbi:hypothetical protein [Ureaplasma ceti]|uniref:Uncharacterized protein n=1 Tax=Ureaplasma ceti TaxID=3119530 RepID=A0ABP9U9A8_9BACT